MWFRQKTKTWDNFVFFRLATRFILLKNPNENLFPHANDATIWKLINKQLRLVEIQYNADKSSENPGYFTKRIRRYAINKESKGLSPDWIDFRVGFKRNNTNHYFTGTFLTDTARTLANRDRIDDGGYSPTMQYTPQSDSRKDF
jgi:hypothetical protein